MIADFGASPDSESGDTTGGQDSTPQPDGAVPDEAPSDDSTVNQEVAEDMGTDHNEELVEEDDDFTGQTDFISADGVNGEESAEFETDGPSRETADADDERTVEEGDIYRVLHGGLILNLNSYRGLQVIDFSDPEEPKIVGRAQVAGSPVEMYVVGDTAYVLLNNWQTYYGMRDDIWVESFQGGVVLSIDVSDPTAPEVVDRATIQGWIDTSRLTRDGADAALYVVSNHWGNFEDEEGATQWQQRTVVKSFALDGGSIRDVSEIVLDGYTPDIQATTRALLVAQHNWSSERPHSTVTLIDIRDAGGAMVQGATVDVGGIVSHKSRMDLEGNVLRVVSGSTWSASTTNHLETFDVRSLNEVRPIDHCTFGEGQSLFATIFLPDRAFFVTYLRVDPFHAFALSAEGFCEEKSEYEVSGWNNFFRPVFDSERLVGIGVNDEGGQTLSVSLYDITDLTNPAPLLARAQVDADSSWSEAVWDDRAFSVIENAVNVTTRDIPETGLVFLPFSGWNESEGKYVAAVQIFTFSESTLTRRGLMVHGTPVRRSFLADDELTANLSEMALSLFDSSVPDEPREVGRVDLAPNYSDLLVFGEFAARLNDSTDFYWGWWGGDSDLPSSTVDIVPMDGNLDTAEAVASIEVASGATLHRVGDLLLAVDMEPLDTSEWPYTYETEIIVWDLSAPTEPVRLGAVTTEALSPTFNYYSRGMIDCLGCFPRGYDNAESTFSVGESLVFLQPIQESELLGTEEVCTTYPVQTGCSSDAESCTSYRGGITCRSLEGAEPVCTGEINLCELADGRWTCSPVDPDTLDATESCYEYERYRYWQRYELHVLDLSTSDAPAFTEPFRLPSEDEGVSALANGEHLWVTIKHPESVEGDPRGFARYFIRDLDLSAPSTPVLGDPINVPGELIAADGTNVYTRDVVWGDNIVDVAVARLRIRDGLAYLQARHQFVDQEVHNVLLDGAGHLVVSHRLPWQLAYDRGVEQTVETVTLLDYRNLQVLSAYDIDYWATLQDAVAGRLLFQVPGGLLVVNTEIPTEPSTQAYFPIVGWPREFLLTVDRLIFAAGRYGITDYDIGTVNLLERN